LENIKFKTISTVTFDKTWFATIQLEDPKLQISVVYKSPAQKPNDFFVFLDEYIAKYLDYATPQIMVGDININVEKSTKTVKDYINLIKEHDLKQIVKEYTRFDIKNNSSSIIDHVLVNNDKTNYVVNRADKISDHYLIRITYNEIVKCNMENSEKNVIRNYSKSKFCEMIDEKCNTNRVDDIQEFFEVIRESISKFIKKEKFKKMNFNFDSELIRLKKEKKIAYDVYVLSCNLGDFENFNMINKSYKEKLRMKKNETFRKQLFDNKNDPKKLWKNLKSLYKSKSEKINFVKVNNIAYDTPSTIANNLNEAFITSIDEIIKNIDDPIRNDYLDNIKSPENIFELVTIDFDNLKFFLKMIKDKNFDDFISGGNLIDICSNENLNEKMLQLINKSIIESEMPEIFKLSVVSPIPKVNNPCYPEDFRPINNYGVGEKLIENIIHFQLKDFLEENNVIVENQHGFRESHSTETVVKMYAPSIRCMH